MGAGRKKGIAGCLLGIVLLFVLVGVVAATMVLNENYIEFTVADHETVYVEYGDSYDDSDVTAYYKGTIWNRQGREIEVSVDGTVDDAVLGNYELTYTASQGDVTKTVKRTVVVEDSVAPVISLVENPDTYTNPNDEYVEEGYTATDNYDGDLTSQVVREESDGVVTYSVSDSFGNTTTVTREIVYKDVVAPEIELSGNSRLLVEAGSDYTDPGYTATDDCDGDITELVKVEGTVDVDQLGEYQVQYSVEDSSQNICTVTRTVVVQDSQAPAIVLNGDKRVYVLLGESYTDEGATAEDACDGDLTDAVSVDNPVDTDTRGVYTVKYSVSDESGNEGTASRTVYVYEKQPDITTVVPEDKVVYLTFDDGPGKYTQKLLDVLDEYNVKVTFFVTNQYSDY